MEGLVDLASLENFAEITAAFNADYTADANTLRYYNLRFKRWQKYLNEVRGISILEANAEDISAYADWLTPQLTPRVRRQYITGLGTLYGFLIKVGIIAGENPYDVYLASQSQYDLQNARNKQAREDRTPEKDKFTDDEIELLLENTSKFSRVHYLYQVIDNAVNAGIRVDGLSKLTLDKFIFDESTGTWYIQLTKGLIPEDNDAKTHSYQVPVPASLVERNKTYVERRNKHGFSANSPAILPEYKNYLFLSRSGFPMKGSNISHAFTNLMRATFSRDEINRRKLSIHSLRKSFGSRKLEEGFEIHEISKMLGHTSIQTTMKYLKYNEREIRASYAEKAKEQDLDFMTQLEDAKKIRKVQKSKEEIAKEVEVIDSELRDANAGMLRHDESEEHYRIRIAELTKAREGLMTQGITQGEQKLWAEKAVLLKQIQNLEEQLQYANSRMKELPNFKFYEKKTKKNLKQQMQARAAELHTQGVGYGKIADIINEEFHTTFKRAAIQYWINKQA